MHDMKVKLKELGWLLLRLLYILHAAKELYNALRNFSDVANESIMKDFTGKFGIA